jgi:hypothetical protein
MSVTLPQFINIRAFLKDNPDGGYEDWVKQYRPPRKKKEDVSYTEEFEKWWCTFPATMKFSFRGSNYEGTRVLRDDKEKTFTTYLEVLKNTGFTDEQLLSALKIEIQERKLATWEHKNPKYNDFQYMKATVAYLNSGKFKYYIDELFEEVSDDEDSNSA